MSCTITRNFPLLPYEPVPQGPTLAHFRNELAIFWDKAAGDIEGCVADTVADIPPVDDSRLIALEEYVYALDFANSYVHVQSSPSATWDMYPETPTGAPWATDALVQLFDGIEQFYGRIVKLSFSHYQAQFSGNVTGRAVFQK